MKIVSCPHNFQGKKLEFSNTSNRVGRPVRALPSSNRTCGFTAYGFANVVLCFAFSDFHLCLTIERSLKVPDFLRRFYQICICHRHLLSFCELLNISAPPSFHCHYSSFITTMQDSDSSHNPTDLTV